jgi:hypothetical protein
MLESEFRIAILDAISALYTSVSNFTYAIKQDSNLCAWTDQPQFSCLQRKDARDQAIAVFEQLEYLDEQDPREIILAPGLLGASVATIEKIRQLNTAKAKFKETVLAFKEAKLSFTDINKTVEELLNKRHPRTANSLKKFGFSRLHLKQCYRQIPLLEQVPEKVSWTWANTRSIKKITIAQAEKMLHQRGEDYGIQLQLKKLSQLPANESVAIVQELAPHLRTNIVMAHGDEIQRFMLKGSLPLFFPADSSTALPEFVPPKLKKATSPERERRNDQRIDPTPFLPAIRGFRYLAEVDVE